MERSTEKLGFLDFIIDALTNETEKVAGLLEKIDVLLESMRELQEVQVKALLEISKIADRQKKGRLKR